MEPLLWASKEESTPENRFTGMCVHRGTYMYRRLRTSTATFSKKNVEKDIQKTKLKNNIPILIREKIFINQGGGNPL